MAEQTGEATGPTGPVGRALFGTARMLAIIGGLLSCAMAALVTVSVIGRYAFSMPVPGDYDLVGIICGCAIFAFLPYCQLKRGNVLADFFTQRAPPRVKAALDALGSMLFLIAAALFTWRLYYGALEMRQSAEQIASFSFYRWWTVPFDIFCMIVMLFAIAYTFSEDLANARAGRSSARPAASGE